MIVAHCTKIYIWLDLANCLVNRSGDQNFRPCPAIGNNYLKFVTNAGAEIRLKSPCVLNLPQSPKSMQHSSGLIPSHCITIPPFSIHITSIERININPHYGPHIIHLTSVYLAFYKRLFWLINITLFIDKLCVNINSVFFIFFALSLKKQLGKVYASINYKYQYIF